MAADRILNIKVSTTSNWVNSTTLLANLTWTQTGQTGLGNSSRVDASGNINLQRMPLDTAFTNNVRIQLTLDDHMTDFGGRAIHSRWAVTGEGSNPPTKAEGFCMFSLACGDTNPINPLNVTPTRVSPNLIRIHDNRVIGQPDNVPYAYMPGMIVELPSGGYFIQLDPGTGGKGTGTSPIGDGDEECETD